MSPDCYYRVTYEALSATGPELRYVVVKAQSGTQASEKIANKGFAVYEVEFLSTEYID